MRRAVWLTTIILLAALGTARAQGPALSVQALPAGGWSAQGALGSGWAWIGPAPPTQELYALNLQVRATTGGPTLQMGSGGDAQAPAWWRWAIPADGKPHRIEMILDLPAGDKLGLALSGAGAAQVDSLQLQPVAKPPAYTDALLTDPQPASAAAPLPDGWEP